MFTLNKFVQKSVLIFIIIITSLFFVFGLYMQNKNIEKSIKNDAGVVADLVFQNLYNIMKNGGNKELLDIAIKDIESNLPDASVKILRNKDELDIENLKNVFTTKNEDIYTQGRHINFASPILFKSECLSCHQTSSVGDVAGVILIEYPILNLQVSLKEIFYMTGVLFVIIILVFALLWYYLLKKYFVNPIHQLAKKIDDINSHKDLTTNIFINSSIVEIKQIENSFNQQNEKLISSYNILEKSSSIDELTGIFNRRKFNEYSNLIIKNAKRYENSFSLLVIDLNKFKFINDTYGHDVGDEILILFTKIVSTHIRETDYLFRVGGDEFILLLPNTDKENSEKLVEKLKAEFKNEPYLFKETELFVNASFGISEFGEDANTIKELLAISDKRMYEQKYQSKIKN